VSIEQTHLRPGDEGFDAIAATITPINLVRKGYSHIKTYINAEPTAFVPRGNESINEIRRGTK
jgi:hypothetical protein